MIITLLTASSPQSHTDYLAWIDTALDPEKAPQ
jgi:hypothetical protein